MRGVREKFTGAAAIPVCRAGRYWQERRTGSLNLRTKEDRHAGPCDSRSDGAGDRRQPGLWPWHRCRLGRGGRAGRRGGEGPRRAGGTARRTRRVVHAGGRERRRPDGGRRTDRQVPPWRAGAQGGRHAAAAADPALHVGDLQPELGRRRGARVPLDTRGAARAAGAGQHRGDAVQRGGGVRLAADGRVRRGQGRHPVADRLRSGRVKAGRAGHPVRLAAAAAHPGDLAWRGVRHRLRRPGRRRGGRPGRPRRGAHPGAGRPGGHRPGHRP